MVHAADSCPDCAKESTQKVVKDILQSGKDFDPDSKEARDLYERDKEKTYATVVKSFKDRMLRAPIIQALGDYFRAGDNPGTCPVWAIDAWVFYLTMDQLCSDVMQSAWPMIQALVLFGFSFLAWRWAVL